MVNMKLWEVLKALEENPEKVFKGNLSCGFKTLMRVRDGYFDLKIFNLSGELIPQEKKGGVFNENLRLSLDWQELKQPVSWQEAIEAWANGKTIGVTQKDIEKRFYEGKDYLLRDQHGYSVSEDEIAEGTWYIED